MLSQNKLVVCFAVLACGLVLTAHQATAMPVSGTPAPFTGTRTVTDPGLATTESDWQDASLTWQVTSNGNGTFDYEYTFRGFDRPEISHFTLDISDDAIFDNRLADPLAITNPQLNGQVIPVEFGDKDGITGAVKFDAGADDVGNPSDFVLIYTFTSNRRPVFHDLYIKGGQSDLTNTGFGDRISTLMFDYVGAPNSVPEPAVFVMSLFGIAGLFAVRRRSTSALTAEIRSIE